MNQRNLNEIELLNIEKKLKEKVQECTLLKNTNSSNIFLIKTQSRTYLLKKNLNQDISEEFFNHQKIYRLFKLNKKNIFFKIPKIYFISDLQNFYLMEYVEYSKNLQEIILQADFKRLKKIFQSLGKAISSYHNIVTSSATFPKESILTHNTIISILKSKDKKIYLASFQTFPKKSYRNIIKDFKATNVLVDKENQIYFIDFQKVNYFAPFYYDFARFIDTTKIFVLIKAPIFYILNKNRIQELFEIMIKNYGIEINESLLTNGFKLHQMEHQCMKKEKHHFFNLIILKILYKMGI